MDSTCESPLPSTAPACIRNMEPRCETPPPPLEIAVVELALEEVSNLLEEEEAALEGVPLSSGNCVEWRYPSLDK